MIVIYGEFAYQYDLLMEELDYEAWTDYYITLMELTGVHRSELKLTICDIACGTASIGLALAKKGHRVICIDRSPDMLRVAAEKARRLGITIPLIQQDMRSFQTHRQVDAVICVCDGVNYLIREQDVSDFFMAANRALRQGGGLFFDISSEYKLSRHIGNQFFGEVRDEVAYLWQNTYDDVKRLLKMDITFFAKQSGHCSTYNRFDEAHVQRAYSIETIRKILEVCGFELKGIFGGQTLSPPEDTELRLHFAAVKA